MPAGEIDPEEFCIAVDKGSRDKRITRKGQKFTEVIPFTKEQSNIYPIFAFISICGAAFRNDSINSVKPMHISITALWVLCFCLFSFFNFNP